MPLYPRMQEHNRCSSSKHLGYCKHLAVRTKQFRKNLSSLRPHSATSSSLRPSPYKSNGRYPETLCISKSRSKAQAEERALFSQIWLAFRSHSPCSRQCHCGRLSTYQSYHLHSNLKAVFCLLPAKWHWQLLLEAAFGSDFENYHLRGA